jgi:hypothetical protein
LIQVLISERLFAHSVYFQNHSHLMSYNDNAQNVGLIGVIVGVVSVPIIACIVWCFCVSKGSLTTKPTPTAIIAPAPEVPAAVQNRHVFDAFAP